MEPLNERKRQTAASRAQATRKRQSVPNKADAESPTKQVSIDDLHGLIPKPTGLPTTTTESLSSVEKELHTEASWLAEQFGYTFDELFPEHRKLGQRGSNGRSRARQAIAYYLRRYKTRTFCEEPTLDMIGSVLHVEGHTVYEWARNARVNKPQA